MFSIQKWVNFLHPLIKSVREKLSAVEPDTLLDVDTWHGLLSEFGFNDENPHELPMSMISQPGLGLRIWQYPNQFAPYMVWLASKSNLIGSYMEIGTRHGGTFVVQVETLRLLNPDFGAAVAVDLIDRPDLLAGYRYRQQDSQSKVFLQWLRKQFFDCIFIDGDHGYQGVKNDAESTIERCNVQVFHDISSDSCIDVGLYWREHKEAYKDTHDFFEFVDQYDSVEGSFLGIGVSCRKDWIVVK